MSNWHIMEGDCLTVLDSIEPWSVDALVFDPPFGLNKIYSGKKETASTPEEYWAWLEPRYKKALKCVKPGGFVAIWQTQKYFRHFWDWYGDDIKIYSACKNFVQLRKTSINYAWDPIVMFYQPGANPLRPEKPKRNVDFFVANTAAMVSNPNRIERKHPFPRPIDQTTEIINNFTIPGGIILDPFCGSATTGVASILNGRNFIGIEIEPEYVNLSKERLKLTQQTETKSANR